MERVLVNDPLMAGLLDLNYGNTTVLSRHQVVGIEAESGVFPFSRREERASWVLDGAPVSGDDGAWSGLNVAMESAWRTSGGFGGDDVVVADSSLAWVWDEFKRRGGEGRLFFLVASPYWWVGHAAVRGPKSEQAAERSALVWLRHAALALDLEGADRVCLVRRDLLRDDWSAFCASLLAFVPELGHEPDPDFDPTLRAKPKFGGDWRESVTWERDMDDGARQAAEAVFRQNADPVRELGFDV